MDNKCELILAEVRQVLDAVDATSVGRLAGEITSAQRIFVAGLGRTGLIAKAFAMRLMHLGRTVFVVGETTTPSIRKGDLLIVCSGKGAKESLAAFMREAAKAGARCAAVTGEAQSLVGKLADPLVVLPVRQSRQFGGSLFEQVLLIFFDALVMRLAESGGVAHDEMKARHTNLE